MLRNWEKSFGCICLVYIMRREKITCFILVKRNLLNKISFSLEINKLSLKKVVDEFLRSMNKID